jgi:Xaa-Pro dipeptidase
LSIETGCRSRALKEFGGRNNSADLKSSSSLESIMENQIDRNLLAFSEATFQQRLEIVQSDLRRSGLAGVLLFNPSNMFWLTGYQTIGYFAFHAMFVGVDAKPIVIAWVVNRDLALAHPTVGNFVTIMDSDDPIEVLANFLNDNIPPNSSVALESSSWFLTVRHYQQLQTEIAHRVVEWDSPIENHRIVKSREELGYIRQAARAAEAGLESAIASIEPGKSENDIAAAMMAASIETGSEYLGHPPLIVAGKTTGLCFAMWRRREIRQDDVVLLESAGCINRYHAMLSRPAIVGKPSRVQSEAADTLQRALEAAIRTIGPGVTAGEVDRACRSIIEERGFGAHFWQETGYGIGIGFPPSWSEGYFCSIRPKSTLVLQPNMTFHIIPTLFFETFGMCFSDSVCVTENGCEVLTNYPQKLFVL